MTQGLSPLYMCTDENYMCTDENEKFSSNQLYFLPKLGFFLEISCIFTRVYRRNFNPASINAPGTNFEQAI